MYPLCPQPFPCDGYCRWGETVNGAVDRLRDPIQRSLRLMCNEGYMKDKRLAAALESASIRDRGKDCNYSLSAFHEGLVCSASDEYGSEVGQGRLLVYCMISSILNPEHHYLNLFFHPSICFRRSTPHRSWW